MKTTLRTYLAAQNIRHGVFAEMVGISKSYMSSLLHGRKRPGDKLMVRITAATGRRITTKEQVADAHSSVAAPKKRRRKAAKQMEVSA